MATGDRSMPTAVAPTLAASSGMIPRPEKTSRTTGGPAGYRSLMDLARRRVACWSPRMAASMSGRQESSFRSAQSTAARAWAIGREANQGKIDFSFAPDPAEFPTAASTAPTGNHRSIRTEVSGAGVSFMAGLRRIGAAG